MTNAKMIFNEEFFRLVWESDVPVPDIAKIYGTSRAAIYRAAHRFKIRPRNAPIPECQVPQPADPPADLDEALIWTRGRWSLMQRVAAEHGLSSTQIQIRYHRIRNRAG